MPSCVPHDIVNPVTQEEPTSSIASMPVLIVRKAKTLIVMKGSMVFGDAGMNYRLFKQDNNRMPVGNGKKNVGRDPDHFEWYD